MAKASTGASDVVGTGLTMNRNTGKTMPEPHIHSDLEMTLVLKGTMDLMFGGRRVQMPTGRFVIHWAARPHCVVRCTTPLLKYGIAVPLPWFLHLQLPGDFTARILRGEMIAEADESRAAEDAIAVERWFRVLQAGNPADTKLVFLEVEARLGWMSRAPAPRRSPFRASTVRHPPVSLEKVDSMIGFITRHYADPISSADVAQSVNLHPKYAMAMFREKMKLTILDYITAQRIAHAQHLLISTNMKTIDVAFQSGFGTVSRFYKAFSDAVHVSPHAYRKPWGTHLDN